MHNYAQYEKCMIILEYIFYHLYRVSQFTLESVLIKQINMYFVICFTSIVLSVFFFKLLLDSKLALSRN